ncbi:NAD(P)/FAD-dependent oxidoreductase [Chengkuizengella axinellae]|uniref:NAD(P)/FAD-dependent oxidoreductase n=1 Tax=Chengkuizengella axinellae TaxID=3064388 RepID=A0ABT9J222_9BACL|nr:NAD(P)/FAD-dependent oxidoreductase [Chengkuizengella sp. 2205SS18-9]MDP5275054.1 NAD(P)/FAD-dependent oxidoreductase [Chengkuizengella sp. 2205SS18-9]
MSYDVIVIGGGPAGLMASISACENGAKVLLVDKGNKLGRKLAISGGGRCNVTNAYEVDQIIKNIPGNGRFLHSAFSNFNNQDIIHFFENLGIQLKEEDRGRMFPVSDKAMTVVRTLIHAAVKLGVHMKTNSPVKRVIYGDQHTQGIELLSGEKIKGSSVIIASGGKSVPHTGSTGDGYAWAEDAGHTITELYPTEVPITSNEPFIQKKELQGLSLRNIELTLWNPKNKKVITHEGDMIFTHFGISGPVALRCSQFVIKTMKKFEIAQVQMSIDLFPEQSEDQLLKQVKNLGENEPKKQIKNLLKKWLPERLIPILLAKVDLKEDMIFNNVANSKWLELISILKKFSFYVKGTRSIEEAFVTGGGVNLKEVNPKTMESKIMNGLFFCGEILDIHGYTGGYNITAAFVTGHTAGKHAAVIH